MDIGIKVQPSKNRSIGGDRRPCLLHRAEAVQLLVQGTEPQKRRVCGKRPEGRCLINGDFMGDFSWVRPKDG